MNEDFKGNILVDAVKAESDSRVNAFKDRRGAPRSPITAVNLEPSNTVSVYCLMIIVLVMLFLSGSAEAGDYRVVTINNSKHFSDSEKYNENHDGFGGEYRIGEEGWIGVNLYTNSFNDDAFLIYYNHEHRPTRKLSYGFQAGYAGGYENPILYSGVYGQYDIIPEVEIIPAARITIIPGVIVSGLVWEFD